MAQAIIDPEEVRRFAAELKRFNNEVRERTTSLMSRFSALGDSVITGPTLTNVNDFRAILVTPEAAR